MDRLALDLVAGKAVPKLQLQADVLPRRAEAVRHRRAAAHFAGQRLAADPARATSTSSTSASRRRAAPFPISKNGCRRRGWRNWRRRGRRCWAIRSCSKPWSSSPASRWRWWASAEPSKLLADSGNVFTVAELTGLGAAGDICLHFFDVDGRPIKPSFDAGVIGITPKQLRRVVAVAGGRRKLRALQGPCATA